MLVVLLQILFPIDIASAGSCDWALVVQEVEAWRVKVDQRLADARTIAQLGVEDLTRAAQEKYVGPARQEFESAAHEVERSRKIYEDRVSKLAALDQEIREEEAEVAFLEEFLRTRRERLDQYSWCARCFRSGYWASGFSIALKQRRLELSLRLLERLRALREQYVQIMDITQRTLQQWEQNQRAWAEALEEVASLVSLKVSSDLENFQRFARFEDLIFRVWAHRRVIEALRAQRPALQGSDLYLEVERVLRDLGVEPGAGPKNP